MPEPLFISRGFSSEFIFVASRSSGPGGQHVNKVSTKIELRFDLLHSALLTDEEKEIIAPKLGKKLNQDGILIIVSQSERSQFQNKQKSIEKFYTLLEHALTPRKKRKPTRPTRAAKEKRLENKRIRSEIKATRKY